MGCCDCLKKKKKDSKDPKDQSKGGSVTQTKNGQTVTTATFDKLPTQDELNRQRMMASNVSEDYLAILSEPYSRFDRITDVLYLTGVGGLTSNNINYYQITLIVNATYEAPLVCIAGIETIRVPVDDDENEDIGHYFDEVADKINEHALNGGHSVVHCVAGVSRSSALVLAYLMKHQRIPLRGAFEMTRKARPLSEPNLGFWRQLVAYEKKVLKKNSVKMVKIKVESSRIQVPDFYQKDYPILYDKAIRREKLKLEAKRMEKEKEKSKKSDKSSDYTSTDDSTDDFMDSMYDFKKKYKRNNK